MNRIVDAEGRPVPLARELGRGGEGSVFALDGKQGMVAKIYHELPTAKKQEKLRLMAAGVDDRLRRYAAWPEATLHRESDRAVVGFIMQRIEQRAPIHMLYSPAQRRQMFPKVRFDFLLFVARNVAAAFDTLHDHGHVLGDVNQGNVLVGEDSQVVLIDCDSFQVRFGAALHRCEVGVAHFTPPELQRVNAFETTTRTSNHDGFGLALLIFHLLMGGRHPFSGVPQSERVGNALEADIRDFRYAYARDATRRLLVPPPRAMPIDAMPLAIIGMFEAAFTESGVQRRPSAADWVSALDQFRSTLRTCARNPAHIDGGHRPACLWCELETEQVYLFSERPGKPVWSASMPASAFDLRGMRRKLEQLPVPSLIQVPALPTLPAPVRADGWLPYVVSGLFVGLACVFVTMLILLNWQSVLFMLVSLIVGPTAVVIWWHHVVHLRDLRLQHLTTRINDCTIRLQQLVNRFNQQRGAEPFLAQRKQIDELLGQYEAHLRRVPGALTASQRAASDQALAKFLGRFALYDWKDARVGAVERVRLQRAGVWTAADITPQSLAAADLKRTESISALLDWRRDLEQKHLKNAPIMSVDGQADRRELQRVQVALEDRIQNSWQKLSTIKVNTKPLSKSDAAQLQVLVEQRAAAYQDYCREAMS